MEKLPQISKKHMKRFFGYMAAYVVAILAMAYLRKDYSEAPWYFIMVMLPAIFTFLALWESYKGVMSMDEMVRRIHLEGVFIGACITGGVTFTWGLFTNMGLPPMDSVMVLPMLIAGWGIGSIVRMRSFG